MLNINALISKFSSKFSLKAEADMLKKLSLYLSAHLSLTESLKLLEDQLASGAGSLAKKSAFSRWRIAVENGRTLAQAFGEQDMVVSEVSRYSAELGEKSGSLAHCLKEAGLQIGKTIAIKKKITGAVAYPIAILVGTIGLVLGLMLFVFPKIIPLFQTLKVTLPLSTRMLIGFSRVLTDYWIAIIVGVVALIFSVVLILKFSQKARELRDKILLRFPLVGQVIRTRIICTTFDSISTLLHGGEQLSDALLSVAKSATYAEYRTGLIQASERVVEGKSLADFFRERSTLFPLYIFGIISVGERTGNMESSVKDISEIAREDLDDKLRILTAALEPILMVSMSFVIGFIALSIILPIYGITSHFQNV